MKTTYKLLFSLGVFIALGLTSCLKDSPVEDQEYGMINLNAYKIIEIPANSTRSRTFSLPIQSDPQAVNTTIHLAAENPAAEDIKVTLSLAESATMLAAYNTANSKNYILLPSNMYSLPNGLDATIAAGEKDVDFTMNVNTSLFDPTKVYAIFVKIASVDKAGYTISGNYNYKMILLAAKNQWDGIYKVISGTVTRYVGQTTPETSSSSNWALNGSLAGNKDIILATTGPNTLDIPPASTVGGLYWANGSNSMVSGIDGVRVTVNSDNTVTMSSATTAANLRNLNDNYYDPDTKRFHLSFVWGATNKRTYEVVLEYKSAR